MNLEKMTEEELLAYRENVRQMSRKNHGLMRGKMDEINRELLGRNCITLAGDLVMSVFGAIMIIILILGAATR